jgi:hypothetical protein
VRPHHTKDKADLGVAHAIGDLAEQGFVALHSPNMRLAPPGSHGVTRVVEFLRDPLSAVLSAPAGISGQPCGVTAGHSGSEDRRGVQADSAGGAAPDLPQD